MSDNEQEQKETERLRREKEAWKKRYKCGDRRCNKVSEGWVEKKNTGLLAWIIPVTRYPSDLFKCKECGQWACEAHIYEGLCRDCARASRGYGFTI